MALRLILSDNLPFSAYLLKLVIFFSNFQNKKKPVVWQS
jgi:hypothetical protein